MSEKGKDQQDPIENTDPEIIATDTVESVSEEHLESQHNQSIDDFEQPIADDPITEREQHSTNAVTPSKKKSSALKWLITIILLAAAGYGSYYGWQHWRTYQTATEKADQITNLERLFNEQNQFITQLKTQMTQQTKHIDELNQQTQLQISALQDQLRATQRRLQNNSTNQKNDWMLAEAEYLIRQAGQKLHFSEDARSIIALLSSADEQLVSVDDDSLTILRQAISHDINTIRSSGNLDIEGISIQLETLKQSVSNLELASVQLTPQNTDNQSNDTLIIDDITSWQHFKDSVSNALDKYYTVHKYNESVKPFISPQQDIFLKQNIMLNLQTAQLAAMQHNQTSYRNSLQEVEQWLNQYYKQQAASTQAFHALLSQLLNQNVVLDLPQTLESLTLVKSISQQKINQWLESDSKAAPKPVEATEESAEPPVIDSQEDELL